MFVSIRQYINILLFSLQYAMQKITHQHNNMMFLYMRSFTSFCG